MDKDTEKILATLSYPIPAIVGLILALVSDTQESKFHGWQGFFWGILIIIIHFFVSFMPFSLWGIYKIVSLVWLVFGIIFAVKAYKGESFEIPVVSDLAKKVMK